MRNALIQPVQLLYLYRRLLQQHQEAPTAGTEKAVFIEQKEEMLQLYISAGQPLITPYSYKGSKLELTELIDLMRELHTAFRSEIVGHSSKTKPTLA